MQSICYYAVEEKTSSQKSLNNLSLGMLIGSFMLITAQIPSFAFANTITYLTSPVTAPVVPFSTAPITSPVITMPTITPTPIENHGNNNNSNNGNNNSSGSATCTDSIPVAPRLFQIKTTDSTALLYITPQSTTVSGYTISYGYKANNMQFGANFVKPSTNGAFTYTIGKLSANKTYYFTVRAVNGCKTSAVSNVLKATTTSRFARPRMTTAWEQMRLLVLSWLR